MFTFARVFRKYCFGDTKLLFSVDDRPTHIKIYMVSQIPSYAWTWPKATMKPPKYCNTDSQEQTLMWDWRPKLHSAFIHNQSSVHCWSKKKKKKTGRGSTASKINKQSWTLHHSCWFLIGSILVSVSIGASLQYHTACEKVALWHPYMFKIIFKCGAYLMLVQLF